MLFPLILCVWILVKSNQAFLLPNTSTAGLQLTSNEFQYLSQLIFSGDQSLHHIESEVSVLEQRLQSLEDEIRSKNGQDFTSRLDAAVQQMNATVSRLNEELNATKTIVQRQSIDYENLKQAFDKEKTNRHQLQQKYTELDMKYQNLLNNSVKEQLQYLDIVANASEFYQHFGIAQKKGYPLGFTVKGQPVVGITGAVAFQTVISNIGGSYNISTGRFTCVYNGIYGFSLNIYKRNDQERASCWIRKNQIQVVAAVSYSETVPAKGYNEGTNFAVLHLIKDDFVDAGDCWPNSTAVVVGSSFSGFLLQVD